MQFKLCCVMLSTSHGEDVCKEVGSKNDYVITYINTDLIAYTIVPPILYLSQ